MDIIDFFKQNYHWIFSGIGIFVIGLFLKRKFSISQNIKEKSSGLQAGGNISININNNNKNDD